MDPIVLKLLLWTGISTILAGIFRIDLGERNEAWNQLKDGITGQWVNSTDTFLFRLFSLVFFPGVVLIALWDWIVCPAIVFLLRLPSSLKHSSQFKKALKKLSPLERQCYDEVKRLKTHREELLNLLAMQEEDDDPNTPSTRTRKAIKEQVIAIEDAERALSERISQLPLSDLPIRERLMLAAKSVERAQELVEKADEEQALQIIAAEQKQAALVELEN